MWQCKVCTLDNPTEKRRCVACNTRRSVSSSSSIKSTTTTPTNTKKPIITNWILNRKKRKREEKLPLPDEQYDKMNDEDIKQIGNDTKHYSHQNLSSQFLVATVNGCDVRVRLTIRQSDDHSNFSKDDDVNKNDDPQSTSSTTPIIDALQPVLGDVVVDGSEEEEVSMEETSMVALNSSVSSSYHRQDIFMTEPSPPPSQYPSFANNVVAATTASPNDTKNFFYTPPSSLTMTATPLSQIDIDDSIDKDDNDDNNNINDDNTSFTPPTSHETTLTQHPQYPTDPNGVVDTETTTTTTTSNLVLNHMQRQHNQPNDDGMVETNAIATTSSNFNLQDKTSGVIESSISLRDGFDEQEQFNVAKVVAQDNWYNDDFVTSTTTTPSIVGFHTAGFGNSIHISTEALTNANRILHGSTSSGSSDHVQLDSGYDDHHRPLPLNSGVAASATTIVGFQTAGFGKNIQISTDALKNANRILHDSSSDHDRLDSDHRTPLPLNKPLPSSSTKVAGFQTAGFGTNIQISTEALKNANRILHGSSSGRGDRVRLDSGYNDQQMSLPLNSGVATSATTIVGFQTAGFGKNIQISTDALKNANRILHDSSSDHDRLDSGYDNQRTPSPLNSIIATSATTVVGFQTAGFGKNIHISTDALKNANRILHDSSTVCDRDRLDSSDQRTPSPLNSAIVASAPTVVGFQTAGFGKNIHISTDALKNANRILHDSSTVCDRDQLDSDQRTPSPLNSAIVASAPKVVGFQTAGFGNNIHISTDALEEANRMLHGTNDQDSFDKNKNTIFDSKKDHKERVEDKSENKFQVTNQDFSTNCLRDTSASVRLLPPTNAYDNSRIHASFQTAGRCAPIQVLDVSGNKAESIFQNDTSNDFSISPSKSTTQQTVVDENVLRDISNIDRFSLAVPIVQPIFASAGKCASIYVSNECLNNAALILVDNNDEKTLEPIDQSLLLTTSNSPNASRASQLMHRKGDDSNETPNVARRYNDIDAKLESESTECYEDTVTPATRDSIHYFSTQTHENDAHTFDAQRAPNSCRSSFSVSFMVKGFDSAFESERNESPVAFFKAKSAQWHDQVGGEAVACLKKDGIFCEGRPETLNGILTPAHRNDVPPNHSYRPFVTPGSKNGKDEWFESNFSGQPFSVHEVIAKELTSSKERRPFGVSPIVIEIDSVNAVFLRFNSKTLLPDTLLTTNSHDSSDLLGSLSDYREALTMLQCDIIKISDAWLTNHVRWIVWKLASAERKLSPILAGICLTFETVAKQLQKRYRKEIIDGAVPAVRRLLNRDISAGCMFMLCVARIKPRESSLSDVDERRDDDKGSNITYLLELTDGWYSLPAVVDNCLTDFILKGTIEVGTKLLISNSLLFGFDDGIDPLDSSFDPFSQCTSPVLHLAINSCRLGRWNSKLGRVRPTCVGAINGMLLVKNISDVYYNGGRIPLIDLRVVRRFPLSYLDRQISPLGTRNRVLTEQEEHARIETLEKQRQILIDALSEEIQAECEKDVDEKAPVAWKNMTEEVSPDYYEGLGDVGKAEIMRWISLRVGLIQSRMQQELESKLDELDIEIKPSKRFLRVHVSPAVWKHDDTPDYGSDEAFVTIWDPTSEQLDLLQVGAVLRMKNLETKSPRFEGLRQFTGGHGTSLFPVLSDVPNESGTKCVSLFSLQLQSKRLLKGLSKGLKRTPDVATVVGTLLYARKSENMADWVVYLTDKSQLIFRIHCVHTCDKLRRFLTCGASLDTPAIVEFGFIRIMQFDFIEQCSVAKYTGDSTFTEKPNGRHATSLQAWSSSHVGWKRILKLRSYMEVGVLETTNFQTEAIGYISGLLVLSSHPELLVRVDCGSPNLQTWRFPLALVSSFVDVIDGNDLRKDIVLNEDEEAQVTKLTKIGRIYRARKKLFRFKLRTITTESNRCNDCNFEVLHISEVDTNALAALYSHLIFNRSLN